MAVRTKVMGKNGLKMGFQLQSKSSPVDLIIAKREGTRKTGT
jgi:hypothetical protein